MATALWGFGLSFWKSFALVFVGHFIIFGLINYFTGIYMAHKMRSIEVEQLRLLSEQSVTVNCASCGEPAIVPIMLGEDNVYTCDQCSTVNTVIISAETALPTTPVSELDPDKVLLGQIKKLEQKQ